MKRKGVYLLFLVLFLSRFAWVQEKVKKMSVQKVHQLENFYLSLKKDSAEKENTENLDDRYKELRKEWDASRAALNKKPFSANRVSSGDNMESAAKKMGDNFAKEYVGELTEFKIRLKGNRSTESGETSRAPANVGMDLGQKKGSLDFGKVKFNHEVFSHQSELEMELSQKVKSNVIYSPANQGVVWSFSAGF